MSMSSSVVDPPVARHRVIPEKANRMARADLRKTESDDSLRELGACLDAARRAMGWTLDQLAAELQRDPRQVARWTRGDERTQVDAVFAVEALRKPFVIALAKLAACEIETTVRIKITA